MAHKGGVHVLRSVWRVRGGRYCSTFGVDWGKAEKNPLGDSHFAVHGDATASGLDEVAERTKALEEVYSDRLRVPRQHPDTIASERRAAQRETEEIQKSVEDPQNLMPYIPPEGMVSSDQDWDTSAPLAPQQAPKGVVSGRGLRARYQRYRRAVQEFHENRRKRKVEKLQQVLASGLVTEYDYLKEVERLGLTDIAELPFQPSAYKSLDQRRTISNYLSGGNNDGGYDVAGMVASDIQEAVALDKSLREEWMQLQEKVSECMSMAMARTGSSKYSALRNEHYFEAIRNAIARGRELSQRIHMDPFTPQQTRVLNNSPHGVLHTKLFSEPLLPPFDQLSSSDEAQLTAMLERRTYESFWAKVSEHLARQRGEKPVAEDSSALVPRTRTEWYAKATAHATWKDLAHQASELHQQRDESEFDMVPEYQVVLSSGDMGLKPDKETLAKGQLLKHPSAALKTVKAKPLL
eukprot:Sspe_Gene.94418::Locus_66799_Transcript_1_1_Confidence_1.000_Length_1536::g.94418::m.94418